MGRDLFSSLKQQKAAISYKKGFPLLALRLPTGTTLWFFGIRPRRGGQAGLSSPFWGENSKRVKGQENPWPSPPRGTRYGEPRRAEPTPGMSGRLRGAYLAQLPQLVSGSGCILLLGGELLLLLFQLAFQDGNRVTLLRSLPARGGTSVGTTITGPIPSNPMPSGILPSAPGEKFSSGLQE